MAIQIKFIDNHFPNTYSSPIPIHNLEETRTENGRTYFLLGKSATTCSLGPRMRCGLRALLITALTLGGALFFKKTRSDWNCFFTGKKFFVIYSSSRFLFNKTLSNRGDSTAQFNLGYMYKRGEEVIQSDTEAFKYYKLAADQGNATAQFNVGFMYESGTGVQQSDKEAAAYYKLAADQGNAPAQCNLGFLYERGEGVIQSNTEAFRYHQLLVKALDNYKLAASR